MSKRRREHFGFNTHRLVAAAVFLLATTVSSGAQDKLKEKDWRIIVGPDPCNLTEDSKPAATQEISKKKKHKIEWLSNAGQTLEIVVHVPADCPAPFKNMTKTGTAPSGDVLWTVDCHKDSCKSGPAVDDACETTYKYDQVLDGKSCDGRIIINP